MNDDFNPYLVKFISKDDIVEDVEDGYSGSLIYKVTKGKEKFFLKVFQESFQEEKIMTIKKYIEIYEKLKIKSLKIIDYGKIENCGKYYIVYNFIEGCNLRVFTNSENCQLSEIRKFGKMIGKQLRKLKDYEPYDRKIFEPKNIRNFTEKAITNFNHELEKKASREIITKYFSIEEIEKLKMKVIEFCELFQKLEPRLIHGDIKRANIMIDEKQELYMVDIESMQVNYDILNFRYQMTWALFDEKETEFVKGYFDGVYNNSRPSDFNQQVIYMMIVNFFNVCYDPEDVEFDRYIKNCKALFERIGNMDLNREFII